jgi:hypothetical protein
VQSIICKEKISYSIQIFTHHHHLLFYTTTTTTTMRAPKGGKKAAPQPNNDAAPKKKAPRPSPPNMNGPPFALLSLADAVACGSAVPEGPIINFSNKELVELESTIKKDIGGGGGSTRQNTPTLTHLNNPPQDALHTSFVGNDPGKDLSSSTCR